MAQLLPSQSFKNCLKCKPYFAAVNAVPVPTLNTSVLLAYAMEKCFQTKYRALVPIVIKNDFFLKFPYIFV